MTRRRMNLTGDPRSVEVRASMKDRRAQEAVTQIMIVWVREASLN